MNYTDVKKVGIDAILTELFDLGHTPHVLVHSNHPDFIGPSHLANEHGFIRFSLGLRAIKNYDVNTKGISFNSSFGGKDYFVDIPYGAIGGIATLDNDWVFPFVVSIPAESEVSPEPKPAPEVKENVIELCPGAEPWRNPNANPDWAKNATVK